MIHLKTSQELMDSHLDDLGSAWHWRDPVWYHQAIWELEMLALNRTSEEIIGNGDWMYRHEQRKRT